MSAYGFDSIPSEIVAAIFKFCLPDPSDYLWHSSLEAPLLLAQICRRWREICLDTPTLWASIAFGRRRSIELLKEWLVRARHHLLTIYLKCEDKTRARMLVDVVKPYCLQWQDIHFALPLSALRQLNTSTFPCLERLTLSSNGAEPSDQTTDPIIIRDAPLLREATISFIPSLQVNLPMEQLTILDFTYMHIPQIVAVLRWCPNLVDLTCDPTCTARGDLHDSPPPVDFHALRSLNIPNENLLVYLTAPRLERLQIGRMFDIQDTTSALHALVSRSSCALKFLSFHFGGVSGTAAQIQQLFRAANTIEHLQFSLTSFKAPLLEALRSADVLPRLRRLEVHDWTTVAGDRARLLLDILVWRRAHGALESFQLVVITSSHCDVPPATIMAEFRALGEAGLEVQITTRKWDDPTPSVVLLDTQQQVT